MKRECGYSYWGFLGDVKMDQTGKLLSTPDGNAFYSWCIIKELQNRGYKVHQIMPDRDRPGWAFNLTRLFSSWCTQQRLDAYNEMERVYYPMLLETEVIDRYITKKELWLRMKARIVGIYMHDFENIDFILHEYRMLIPGRNDVDSIFDMNWQPDYLIQEAIFEYCEAKNKKLFIFDLDYKLEHEWVRKNFGCMDFTILELGTKWADLQSQNRARHVYIPFDFDHINDIPIRGLEEKTERMVYVGNRYERDWCIDKYIFEDLECKVYGNWLERGRDSKERWPNISFGPRLQTVDMKKVYGEATCTILFAKREYCTYGFMTARILEAIFYGTVPLFIEEYRPLVIDVYAGKYKDLLTVHSDNEVCAKVNTFSDKSIGSQVCEEVLQYLRDRLRFMDVRNFVDILMEVTYGL